jgi:hypothetical protein
MNNKITFLFIVTFLLGCLQNKNNTPNIVAIVNKVSFTETMLKNRASENPHIPKKEQIDAWINDELLYQAALNLNIHTGFKLKATIDQISRALTIKTYLDLLYQFSIKITHNEIKEFYTKNKREFYRKTSAARINHFIIKNKKEALKIKAFLLKQKSAREKEIPYMNFRVFSGIVEMGTLNNIINTSLFKKNKKTNVIGPLNIENNFHLVEVLETFPKGTAVGLDIVYDEIYQRLINRKQAVKKTEVLDSLKNKAEIAINYKIKK